MDGNNELKESKQVSAFNIFLYQFKSPIVWILIVCGIVDGLLGDLVEGSAIFAIVVLNAVIGFYQEFRSEKSIAALKRMTAAQAKVRRDGELSIIPASQVVRGDILAFEAGDLVAADARLLKASSLRCIESALTGESEAVMKEATAHIKRNTPLGDRKNMLFMGTSIAAGTGEAVVVATAMMTELGSIAGMIETAEEDQGTPLQRKLDVFGRTLVWLALGIVAVLFGLGLLRGTDVFELFLTSISLAVAAVPEGLPAVVTVALSLGVRRMARRRALVRKLAAVETLGSTSVICTDKTGTLTVGEMTVRALYVGGQTYEVTGEGYGPEGEVRLEGKRSDPSTAPSLLELANVIIGCNNAHLMREGGAWKVVGDPTEGALLAAGRKAGGDQAGIEKQMPVLQQVPFDSDRKRSAVIRRMLDGKTRLLLNGAPGVVLKLCTHFYSRSGVQALTEQDRAHILAETSVFAKKALRVIASAYRDLDRNSSLEFTAAAVERDLVFVGLTGMKDPPRPEAKEAIAKCRSAGIRVVMITGDHPQTAVVIAQELGITSRTIILDTQKVIGEGSIHL